jgi:hypothetical protein
LYAYFCLFSSPYIEKPLKIDHKTLQLDVRITIVLFGKAKCKLCNNNVRFALRHLKEKHPETLKDTDVIKLNMSRIMEKYFI